MARFRPRRNAGRTAAPTGGPGPREEREPHPGWGTGTRVWLIRHGEVHEDWRGVAYGDLDVPLSEAGRADTERLAQRFAARRPDLVLSSPLQRALELGRAVAAVHGAELRVEGDLREVHRGSWQGRRIGELHELDADSVEAFYADPWSWRGHGGESDSMVWRRAWRVLERVVAPPAGSEEEARDRSGPVRADARSVLVASHYNVIRVVVAHALGIAPPRSFGFRLDPGRAVLLVDGASGWMLRYANVAGPPADATRGPAQDGSADASAADEPAESRG